MAARHVFGVALCVVMGLVTFEATAQVLSKDEILQKLTLPQLSQSQQPLTRGFKPKKRGIDVDQAVGTGRLGVGRDGKEYLQDQIPDNAVAETNPSTSSAGRIDLQVTFKVNSSDLTYDATYQLRELANALKDNAMASSRIRIAGHTDASGSDRYNMDLSRRRANAVRDFLVFESGIQGNRLEAVGYGEDRLLDQRQPTSSANRRVEIVNLGG